MSYGKIKLSSKPIANLNKTTDFVVGINAQKNVVLFPANDVVGNNNSNTGTPVENHNTIYLFSNGASPDIYDSTSDIQSAIDNLSASGGGVVQLSPEQFAITNTITIKPNVVLQGTSKKSTIYMRKASKPAVFLPGKTEKGGIRNLSILGNYNHASDQSLAREYIGLRIGKRDADKSIDENALYHTVIKDIDIYGFGTGLETNLFVWTLFVNTIRSESCEYGFWNNSTDNTFVNLCLTGCYSDGLHVSYSGNCKYLNIFAERCGKDPVDKSISTIDTVAREGYGINYRGGDNDTFDNITLIENYGIGAYVQNGIACSFTNVHCDSNGYKKVTSGGNGAEGVRFNRCNGLQGSIFSRNQTDKNCQIKTFSTNDCKNVTVFYSESSMPEKSTYSGENVRFLTHSDFMGTIGGGTGGNGDTGGTANPSVDNDADYDSRIVKFAKKDTQFLAIGTSITEQTEVITPLKLKFTGASSLSETKGTGWCGWGGARAVDVLANMNSDKASSQQSAYTERYSTYIGKANVVTFECGINDWRTDTSIDSYKTALTAIYKKIRNDNPQAILIFFTPHYCYQPSFTNNQNGLGLTVLDYAKAMIDFCSEHNILCVDCRTLWNSGNYTTYLKNETYYIHPNSTGGDLMADTILTKLNEKYVSLFGSSGGIGSGSDSEPNVPSDGLPESAIVPISSIGVTNGGSFTPYTSDARITKIGNNYKINGTFSTGEYVAIETGNTSDSLRLAIKTSGVENGTIYNATSLTATSGTVNTIAQAYGLIQTPKVSTNHTGFILVSFATAVNAEIYVYEGTSYSAADATLKQQIVNTFTN